jgi:release factor glutamine methyltransferase
MAPSKEPACSGNCASSKGWNSSFKARRVAAGERFDLIASNPPYIEDDDPHLAEGDLRFEPRSALASGADGLDDLRLIACAAPAHLRPDGWLLVEHGWQQGAAVRALFDAAGFIDIRTERDLEGRDRVTLGRHPA